MNGLRAKYRTPQAAVRALDRDEALLPENPWTSSQPLATAPACEPIALIRATGLTETLRHLRSNGCLLRAAQYFDAIDAHHGAESGRRWGCCDRGLAA
jgi:hypothetical protein